MQSLGIGSSIVVEQSTHKNKFEGSNPTAAGTGGRGK